MKAIEEEFPPAEHYGLLDLQVAYTRLRSRAVEMERALADIAKQQLADEMDDHTSEHADWQVGYEECVNIARHSLSARP
jgi:hypothetical protein